MGLGRPSAANRGPAPIIQSLTVKDAVCMHFHQPLHHYA
jgi:hypothetical protein